MKFDIIKREVYKFKTKQDDIKIEQLYYVAYAYYEGEKIKFLIEYNEEINKEGQININYHILDVFNENKYLLEDIVKNYDKNEINNNIGKKISEYHSTRTGTDSYRLNILKYPSISKCTEIIESVKNGLNNIEDNEFCIFTHIGVYIRIYVSLEKDNKYINIDDINGFTKLKLAIKLDDVELKNECIIFDKIGKALDDYISLYNNNIYDIYYKKKYNVQESDIICLRKPNTFAIRNNKRIVYYDDIEDGLSDIVSLQFKKPNSKYVYGSIEAFCKSLN